MKTKSGGGLLGKVFELKVDFGVGRWRMMLKGFFCCGVGVMYECFAFELKGFVQFLYIKNVELRGKQLL